MTALYSILHLLVDGVCALAMFGRFLSWERGYFYILIYNFCAFALQMPLGVVLDAVQEQGREKEKDIDRAFLCAAAGVLCTIVGAFTHPAVLGMGNALFHVGGGVGTIREDDARNWKGRGLGVFVAPGALGLYVGTLAGKGGAWSAWVSGGSALMALLCAGAAYGLWRGRGKGRWPDAEKAGSRLSEGQAHENRKDDAQKDVIRKIACICVLVVVLRSYIGMAVSFPWKSGSFAGMLAVLAVVGGKAAGGFGAARYGLCRTTVVSLGLSAICYLFSAGMPVGLGALLLFNMTMPITLYWLVRSMPGRPGFAFGLLTFALFLGFLPVYFGAVPTAGGNVLGCVGSLASLLLLAAGIRVEARR